MAKVDVIIPCYNYGRFLTDCVSSVLEQSVQDVRVLIIDDASSDNSVAVARELAARDPRVEVSAHASNKGHIATYNEGIAWAEGEYCLLLSADDLLAPGALERATAVMDGHSEVGLTYGDCVVWQHDCPRPIVESAADWSWSRRDLATELCEAGANFVPTPTAIARTRIQKAVGFYRPELPHSGDLEMWLRFAAYADVVRIDANQAVYRKHSSAMSNPYVADMLRDYRQRKEAFASFFATCRERLADAPRLQRKASRALADQCFESGVNYLRQGRIESGWELLRWAIGEDRRLLYLPPVWRLLRPPGRDGRRRILAAARDLITHSAARLRARPDGRADDRPRGEPSPVMVDRQKSI